MISKKKSKILFIFSLFTMLLISSTPTYAKYYATFRGDAWKTGFSIYTIVSEGFSILDDNIIDHDNNDSTSDQATSDALWGTESGDGSFTLGSLSDKAFKVQNLSDHKILIQFEVVINLFAISDWFASDMPFVITNTFTDESIEGIIDYRNDSSDPKAVKMENLGSAGWGTTRYRCLIDPQVILNPDPDKLVERNFVIPNDGKVYTFNINIDFSLLGMSDSSISNYFSLKMIGVPYSG